MKITDIQIQEITDSLESELRTFIDEIKGDTAPALVSQLKYVGTSSPAAITSVLQDDGSTDVMESIDNARRHMISQCSSIVVTYGIRASKQLNTLFTRLLITTSQVLTKVLLT